MTKKQKKADVGQSKVEQSAVLHPCTLSCSHIYPPDKHAEQLG